MTNEQRNAYMKEWNRKHMAAMSPEERAAYNKRKNDRDKARRKTFASSHEKYNARMRQWHKDNRASMTPEELEVYRVKKWEREKRRLENPEARAARRASAIRYNRSKYEKLKQYQHDFKVVLKAEMLTAYGSICACCGEPESVFLTLDHIKGNGAADRRARKVGGGYAMYLQLRKEGWPKGYQILCFNCNFAKKTGPACPHEGHYLKLVTAPRDL